MRATGLRRLGGLRGACRLRAGRLSRRLRSGSLRRRRGDVDLPLPTTTTPGVTTSVPGIPPSRCRPRRCGSDHRPGPRRQRCRCRPPSRCRRRCRRRAFRLPTTCPHDRSAADPCRRRPSRPSRRSTVTVPTTPQAGRDDLAAAGVHDDSGAGRWWRRRRSQVAAGRQAPGRRRDWARAGAPAPRRCAASLAPGGGCGGARGHPPRLRARAGGREGRCEGEPAAHAARARASGAGAGGGAHLARRGALGRARRVLRGAREGARPAGRPGRRAYPGGLWPAQPADGRRAVALRRARARPGAARAGAPARLRRRPAARGGAPPAESRASVRLARESVVVTLGTAAVCGFLALLLIRAAL